MRLGTSMLQMRVGERKTFVRLALPATGPHGDVRYPYLHVNKRVVSRA